MDRTIKQVAVMVVMRVKFHRYESPSSLEVGFQREGKGRKKDITGNRSATTSVNSSQNLSHMVVLAKMKDSVRKCTKITCYLFINLKYELG